MSKISFLFFFIFNINSISNYIILPIETLPKENYIEYPPKDPIKEVIFSEYYTSIFSELYIGTKSQKVPILIEPRTNDYLITSIHQMENNISDYYLNKTIFNFSPNFLNNYDFFDENKTSSISCDYCEERKKNIKDIPVSQVSCPAKDIFSFNQGKEKIKLYFELGKNIKDNITGIIGLGLYDAFFRKTSSFLYILNQNNITKNNFWFFDFDKNPENKGKKGRLYIGALLDEIYKNKYDRKDLVFANANQGYSYYKVNFDKIYVKIFSYEYDLDEAFCELVYDTNIIIANSKYKKYFELNLNELMKQQKCFNEKFLGQNNFYNNKNNLIFYYCKNEKDIKEKLYDIILPINFYSSEFNYTFEINIKDILIETNDFIYFKILFEEKNLNYWVLGKIFTLKYKFIFNPELKKVGFYPRLKDNNPDKNSAIIDDNSSKNKTLLQILIIIPCSIGLIILGIIVGKKIYGIKKSKKAYELNDDYEYLAKDKNEEDGENKNNFCKNEIN